MNIEQEVAAIKSALQHIDFSDEQFTRDFVRKLINLIEAALEQNRELKEQNQQLKDEISHLKGEKESIKRTTDKSKTQSDTSNDKDTPENPIGKKPKKKWKKRRKRDTLEIDHEKTIPCEKTLPADAEFKGYRTVIVQGIEISRNNVAYHLQRFYSPSEQKTYEAELPPDVKGGYSAELKAWVIYLNHMCRVPQAKIHTILSDIGIEISAGEISNILTKDHDAFHQEKNEIIKAGIASSTYQHTDDTRAKVSGQDQYLSVLCNEYYSAFFTHPHKDRLTVLKILNQEEELRYTINDWTIDYLKQKRVPAHVRNALSSSEFQKKMAHDQFVKSVKYACPRIKKRYLEIVCEAAAICCYQDTHSSEKIKILLTDAARQFVGITEINALCWIHEERHYKKLIPVFDQNKALVEKFRGKIWDFYRKLQQYKLFPNQDSKEQLDTEFDKLFSEKTGYDALDKCIQMTMSRKAGLLAVLDNPEIPLHNNPAELAVREYVVRRNIISQTRSEMGTRCLETFLSIRDTCRKLGVNFFFYIRDRISKAYLMPSLASLIPQKE